MAVARPSYQEIVNRIYSSLRAQTAIQADLDTSAVGVLVKTFAAELDRYWQALEATELQADLLTATGAGLDRWGNNIGVPRKPSENANSYGQVRPLRFTNTGNSSITIPANTRCWAANNPQFAYFTTEGITLTAGSQGEVHVTAAEPGDVFNVSIHQINRCNFPGSVVVDNILPLTNGSFVESDDSYRERLVQEYRGRVVFNKDTAVALLRSIPGVKDVFVIEKARGPGSFDAIIVPTSTANTASVVQEAQRLLAVRTPVGISAVAKAPVYRYLDVRVQLKFNPNQTTQRESARETVRAEIAALIDGLPVENGSNSGSLFIAQLRGIALSVGAGVIGGTVQVGLDGTALGSEGEIKLSIGERLVLRGLVVQ